MSTSAAQAELRAAHNPLFNNNKLKLGLFGVNVSNGCAITTIEDGHKVTWPTVWRSPEPPTVTATRRWCRWRAGAASAARAISTARISRPTPGPRDWRRRPKTSACSPPRTCRQSIRSSPQSRRRPSTISPTAVSRSTSCAAGSRPKSRCSACRDGARHALRLRGRMDRDHEAPVVARGGVRLRRQVPARQQRLLRCQNPSSSRSPP